METREAIKKRRSVRTFSEEPVTRDFIEKVVDAGRLAPTARNIQPWEFIVITKRQTLQQLAALADNGRFLAECSCCIAIFCKETAYYLEDGCAATENILIAATDLGLSSCWVAGDKKPYCELVKKMLAAPPDYNLVSLIALGYGPSEGAIPTKRPLEKVLHWEKF